MPVWINILEFNEFELRVIENCLDEVTARYSIQAGEVAGAYWIMLAYSELILLREQ